MKKHWSTRFIGLPYSPGGRERDGVDCWGLLRLIYWEERRILLPSLPGLVEDYEQLISRENLALATKGWVGMGRPCEWAAVGMSRKERIHHVGVWTDADGGKVIHIWNGKPAVADTPKSLLLQGVRIIQYFVWLT